jgi:hypothetical protein
MPEPKKPSQTSLKERPKKLNGIDYSRAYNALIKGYVQVYTASKLKEVIQPKKNKGEQQ